MLKMIKQKGHMFLLLSFRCHSLSHFCFYGESGRYKAKSQNSRRFWNL